MRKLLSNVSGFWTESPRRLRVAVIFMACLSLGLLWLCMLPGCATTSAGIAREQAVYSTATNVVAKLTAAAPAIPAPYGTLATDILFVVSGLLAVWNTWQHKAITSLQNGQAQAAAAATPAAPASGDGPAG